MNRTLGLMAGAGTETSRLGRGGAGAGSGSGEDWVRSMTSLPSLSSILKHQTRCGVELSTLKTKQIIESN